MTGRIGGPALPRQTGSQHLEWPDIRVLSAGCRHVPSDGSLGNSRISGGPALQPGLQHSALPSSYPPRAPYYSEYNHT